MSNATESSVIAAIEAQARNAACDMTKDRARDYLVEPRQLDMLRRGFQASLMSPGQLVEFAKEVLLQEFAAPHRFELVPVKKVNAGAAIIAGRYMRAKASRHARGSI